MFKFSRSASIVCSAAVVSLASSVAEARQATGMGIQVNNDYRRFYDGNGSMSFSHPYLGAVSTPWTAIPPKQNPENWRFEVRGGADGFFVAKADAPQLFLRGEHLLPPDAGEGANTLPQIATPGDLGPGKPFSINAAGANRAAVVSAWDVDEHTGPKTHYDKYMIKAFMGTYQPGGASATMQVPFVEVDAVHSWYERQDFGWQRGVTLAGSGITHPGSSPGTSKVSYNSSTGVLQFAAGAVDMMDQQGGSTYGVDASYSSDAMLGATITVSDLSYQGMTVTGLHKFGPGSVTVTSPDDRAYFTGSFDEFLIGDTTRTIDLNSFAIVDSGGTIQQMDDETDPPPSMWLEDFHVSHLTDHSNTPEGFDERWIDLSFVTDTNLVDLTNGFTADALNIPADIRVGGIGLPEPSSALLLVIGGIFGLRRRRGHGTIG